MKLRYTPRALTHLVTIAEYIAQRNPHAAVQVGVRIREITALLTSFPYLGREGTLPGTREIVVPGLPYIVVYRVEIGDWDSLVILGIYHGARRH